MSRRDLDCFDSIEALPPSAAALFDDVGGQQLFSSRPWFESFVAAGLSPGVKPIFFTLDGNNGQADAMIACRRTLHGDPTTASLTSFYSCDFRPLLTANGDLAATAFDLGRKLALRLSGEAVIGFDSLDASLAMMEPFLAGLKIAGRAVLRYDHFGRWWENVEGRDFAGYLSARDGALREVVRRKGAKLTRDGARLSVVGAAAAQEDVERGIADYESVYAASWKEAEPFPEFQPVLMRKLAEAGWLRLALCHLGDRPIAAQLWVVVGGTATVLKLAHDKAFDKQSPGSVLTAFAIRTLMDQDPIATIDFGRGDDTYKRAWSTNRTAHIGVLSVDIKRRPLMVARHQLGVKLRGLKGAARDA